MLYNVLVGFVLHNYIIPQKAASFLFLDAAFSFVFYSAFFISFLRNALRLAHNPQFVCGSILILYLGNL